MRIRFAWLGILLAMVGSSPAGSDPWLLREDFSVEPTAPAWERFGDESLFVWRGGEGEMEVAWDTARPNSYLRRRLGRELSRADDFAAAFDLKLLEIEVGFEPDRPSTFPIVIGFQQAAASGEAGFLRGTGRNSPSLVEFGYFADSGFGATVWPGVWSTNGTLNYNGAGDYSLVELPPNVPLRVSIDYAAADQTLRTVILADGQPLGPVRAVRLSPAFTDFRVDTFAIMSFSGAGQAPRFGGSVRARAVIDNLVIQLPPPPVREISMSHDRGRVSVEFGTVAGWDYSLERSPDLVRWLGVPGFRAGTGERSVLEDAVEEASGALFYRVRATRGGRVEAAP